MNTPPELRDIMKLYAGQATDEIRDEPSREKALIKHFVSELRRLSEAESQAPITPVIIMRSSSKLPWILGLILALVVGFLLARITTPAEPAPSLEEQFGFRFLSEDRTELEFTKGDIYSLSRQVFPLLRERHQVDLSSIRTIVFSGQHVSVRNEDLQEIPDLSDILLQNCHVHWDADATPSFLYFEAHNCTGLEELDLSDARSLKVLLLSDCHDLQLLRGLERLSQLCRLKIDTCSRLREVSGLESLDGLVHLEITSPAFPVPDAIFMRPRLKSVYVASIEMPSLNRFSSLRELEVLSVDSCHGLTDISAVRQLERLTDLNVGSQNVADWSPLEGRTLKLYVGDMSQRELERIPIHRSQIFLSDEFWKREAEKHANPPGYCY